MRKQKDFPFQVFTNENMPRPTTSSKSFLTSSSDSLDLSPQDLELLQLLAKNRLASMTVPLSDSSKDSQSSEADSHTEKNEDSPC